MSSTTTDTKHGMDCDLETRCKLIGSNWPIEQDVKDDMQKIKDELSIAAFRVKKIVQSSSYDRAKLVQAIDFISMAKDAAVSSIILPTYKPVSNEQKKE